MLPAPGLRMYFVDGHLEVAAGCRVERGLREAASKACRAELGGKC